MTDISIMIEGQMGLTWPRWKGIAAAVDAGGFAGLFRSDHFTDPQPPNRESLELTVSLTYLADRTKNIHFGPLVAPVSFRDPIMFARQAAAIDDLSGGRMILGLGAGWQEREHNLFGYELGDIPTRFARLTEALEVVTRLLRDDAPEPFEGRFFQLREGASLLPRPQRPGGPPIMIGGSGPKRTLPLVARYATIWNGTFMSPDDFRARSALLDAELRAVGREPGEVRRTMMASVFFGRDADELEQVLAGMRQNPQLKDLTTDEIRARLRSRNAFVGTGDEIRQQVEAYAAAGVQELMLQWLALDDTERLRAFGQAIR